MHKLGESAHIQEAHAPPADVVMAAGLALSLRKTLTSVIDRV